MSLNNESCMIRLTLINLNPDALNYYLFTVILDKCSESCNAADNLSRKVCVPRKTKNVSGNTFNITTRINEDTKLWNIFQVTMNTNIR